MFILHENASSPPQGFWHSWQSGRFRHRRPTIWNPISANCRTIMIYSIMLYYLFLNWPHLVIQSYEDNLLRRTSGQSYKNSTLVNYDSRVVITSKLLILTTPRVVIYERRGFIRLATGAPFLRSVDSNLFFVWKWHLREEAFLPLHNLSQKQCDQIKIAECL